MAKVIDSTNLGYLIGKIKAAFWRKSETTELSIDNTPTANSNNLVKSGGVKSALDDKQDTLVSGTSIKTINNESLLGSGNITISGGGVVPDLGNAKIFYGTCSSAGDATTKVVDCSSFTSADLVTGALIFVRFSNTNSGAVSSLKMNVNSTGDISIKKQYNASAPANLTAAGELRGSSTYLFQYNGTNWVCMTLDYNSTYSAMTDAEVTAGTSTGNRTITPSRLKFAIQTWAPNNVFLAEYGTTTYAEVKAAYDAGKWVFCKRELNPDLYIIPLSFIDPSSGSEQANFSIITGSNELSLAILDGTDDSWTFNTYVCGNVTGIKMNGTTNSPSSGIVDLGTVITSHQDISGKQDTIVSNSVITGVSSGGIRAIKGTDNKIYALSTMLTSAGDDYTLARLSDVPTVNNSTITIQKGGSTVDTFTTNASSAKSINIPNELPSYSSSDSGKILSVNSSGNLVWLTPAAIRSGSGTPSNSTGNNGDIYIQS